MAQYASYDGSFVSETETKERVAKALMIDISMFLWIYLCHIIISLYDKYRCVLIRAALNMTCKADQKHLKVELKQLYKSYMSMNS